MRATDKKKLQLVQDIKPNDDSNLLTTEYDGDSFDCQIDCIEEKVKRACKKCRVQGSKVFCEGGEIPFYCRRRCCDVVLSGDMDPNDGELQGNEFLLVADYGPDNDGTLMTFHDSKYFLCEHACIEKKAGGKCQNCQVSGDEVLCKEARVWRSCRNKCCEEL